MAVDALKLAGDMLENIKSLMKEVEDLERERAEWADLCQELHDAYKLNVSRLEDARNELIKHRNKIKQLVSEIENLKKSPQQHVVALSQDDLKRIRRFVHPDFTKKETGDLFRTVNGMIK